MWQVIADLQPQAVASLPAELTRTGVSAQLDGAGRVKLTRADVHREGATGSAGGEGGAAAEPRSGPGSEVGHGGDGAETCGAGRRLPDGRDAAAETGGMRAGGGKTEGPHQAAAAAACEHDGMIAELRDMGLHVHVDPDTGLVDIAHPQAPPAKFTYG